MSKKELSRIENFSEYLANLQTLQDCLIFITVCDNAGFWLNEDNQKELEKLGLKETLYKAGMVGYVAVIESGKIIVEEKSIEHGIVRCNTRVAGYNIRLLSCPFKSGNCAKIIVDNEDIAINTRGINIAIWDLEENQLIDSVAFDTHVSHQPCNRQPRERMNYKYDIGLVGWWYNNNYGAILTYYGLKRTLEKMGYSVLMIPRCRKEAGFKRPENTIPMRFSKKYYVVAPVSTFDDLEELNSVCDTFVLGSDQIFNPHLSAYVDSQFYLTFANDDKNKIAYASSFGNRDFFIAEKQVNMDQWLKRFNALSAREDYAVDIFADFFGLKAQKVVDPVFLCDVREYAMLAEKSDLKKENNYFVSFLLDPNSEKRDIVLWLREQMNMTSVNLLDAENFEKNVATLNLDNTKPNVDVEEWLFLYKNADFVVTDSFHGTCFSIIFRKKFISIANAQRGTDRFKALLNEVGLTDRLVYNFDDIKSRPELFNDIDYDSIYEKFNPIVESSKKWLKKAIETPVEKLKPIMFPDKAITNILNKNMCTGCGACVSSCPCDALTLQEDDLGYYRSKIDYEKCINCGKCTEVCPALHLPENSNEYPKCYEFIAADEELLNRSSSGGAFGVFAEKVLQNKGEVVGAAWRDDFSVEHIIVGKMEDLSKLQKSKYLQSYMGNIYRDIKRKLEDNIQILFSGCPCQVAGLKAYLRKDYDNLLLIDLLCANAPSTTFFQKYIEDSFPEGVKKYEFRHKVQGWNADCVTLTLTLTDGTSVVRRGAKQDNYQRVYHNHVMCAPHCEKCKFQNAPRFGDITIGDFWGLQKKDSSINVERGVSAVLCNNKKGETFFASISDEKIKVKKEVPVEWLSGNGFVLGNSNWCSPKRNEFYNAIKQMPFSKAVDYAMKPNHGMYDEMYQYSNTLLQYNTQFLRFKFDKDVWEEQWINGKTVLYVKPGMSKVGKYAVMPLCRSLKKGSTYECSCRFRIKTESPILNLHVKDSGSNLYQVIKTCKLMPKNKAEWQEITFKFVSETDIYDEFMIGASQVKGTDNYIVIDYINIREC